MMKNLTCLCIVLCLMFGCRSFKGIPNGDYYAIFEKEKESMISMTIRFHGDKTFLMFGVLERKNKKNIGNDTYDRYVSFGDWEITDKVIVLNSNMAYQGRPNMVLKLSDSKYQDFKPWDYGEAVLKIEQDSFVLKSKKNLYSIKRDVVLSKQ